MDWRDSHAVTPVKDQKRCNSCWAFATMGALESHLYLKTKKLRSLSAQYLVDCSNRKPYGNSACHGGGLVSSYEFIKDKGACTTDSYRYKGKQRACNYGCRIGAKIDDIVALTDASEEELKDIVGNIGPIAVTINANSWKQYSQSVFNNKNCDTTSNHAVLIVGYGHDNQTGLDYWLLKNSWGADWGERGYMRLARNKQNQCGIGKIAAYPIVAV
ncbi:cathepsin L [Drosophila busckii]|nr:cathepsin L [Drosophila busckii]